MIYSKIKGGINKMGIGDRVEMATGCFEGIQGTIKKVRPSLKVKSMECKEEEYIIEWDDPKYGSSNWMRNYELRKI